MIFADLASLPAHLLAASIQRGRQSVPVSIRHLRRNGLVIGGAGGAPLALHERTLLTIACPLADTPCEIMAEAVRQSGGLTWLALV